MCYMLLSESHHILQHRQLVKNNSNLQSILCSQYYLSRLQDVSEAFTFVLMFCSYLEYSGNPLTNILIPINISLPVCGKKLQNGRFLQYVYSILYCPNIRQLVLATLTLASQIELEYQVAFAMLMIACVSKVNQLVSATFTFASQR